MMSGRRFPHPFTFVYISQQKMKYLSLLFNEHVKDKYQFVYTTLMSLLSDLMIIQSTQFIYRGKINHLWNE